MGRKPNISYFSVILAFVCLTLVGLALIPKLSIKLSPSESLPQVNVNFSMQGSSPRVVEVEATSKLEAMLNRMKGVEEIGSSSGNGWGSISIRLDKHTDIDAARFEVSSIIRQTWASLPQNVSYPAISLKKVDENSDKPFLSYTINAQANPLVIQQYAEKQIKSQLSQIEGIYRIDVSGAMPMEWQMEYDYKQLEIEKIDVRNIRKAVSDYLNKEFLGTAVFKTDNGKQWIRVVVIPDNVTDFNPEDIDIKNVDGKIIKLGQLVKINRVEAEPQSYYRINGLNSIYVNIIANDDANQLTLSKEVKKHLANIQISLPLGYEIHPSYDATEYIQTELEKIYFRTGLSLLILFLFIMAVYRNVRYIFMIVISIFINISIALIFYYLLHLEIQLYSLAGLTISLTLVIDNMIVMSDQIIRRSNLKAFMPILAATLTTIASLSVIFFLEEKLKLNLQDFAYVIIINLIVSLFVALFLVPALLEKLKIVKNYQTKQVNGLKKIRKIRRYYYFDTLYTALCRFTCRWRKMIVACIILAFGLPVFLLPAKIEREDKWGMLYNETLGSEKYQNNVKPYVDNILGGALRLFVENVYEGSYFSERGETTLYVTASLPSNATLQQMNNLIQKMESYLSQFREIKQFQTTIYNAQQASINIYFTKENQKSNFPHILKSKLITRSLQLGGGSWSVVGLGDGFSNEVRQNAGSFRVEMFGFNYDELAKHAQVFKEKLMKNPRIQDVIINSEFSLFKDDYQEFSFDVNKEKLSQENIQPYQLYSALDAIFGRNIYIGQVHANEGAENIMLSSIQSNEYDIWNLYNIPVRIGERDYKLSELVRINKVQAPPKIAKVNQQYRLCLQYEYIGSNEQGTKSLKAMINEFQKQLPMGYTIKYSDSFWRWSMKDNNQYGLLLLIFVIIFFVSSVLFNSVKQPLSILSVIPISFIGIFLTFYLFDLNFDQGGFAAFVLLSGITINANIYIVDEYNNVRIRYPNISKIRAYLKAWNAKARPIFITVISTMLGFIPFLIGENKEAFWFPLAAGTIGGLFISLFATFMFLPMFMGVENKQNKKDK